MIKYTRILLKLSGECLSGDTKMGIDFSVVKDLVKIIKECKDCGVQIGIVVGGGNFWRGRSFNQMEKYRSDYVGMLATAMNSLVLSDALIEYGVETRVQTSIFMPIIAEYYTQDKAIKHLNSDKVVIFGCGTGNPYFSTDTAAVLRGLDIKADIIFKATMVDGVYNKDPMKYSDAIKFDELNFSDITEKKLNVIDMAAAVICKDNNLPILVFSIKDTKNILNAINGEKIGTIIK